MGSRLLAHWDQILAAEGLSVLEPSHQTNGNAIDPIRFPSLDTGSDGEPHADHQLSYRDPDSDTWIQPSIFDLADQGDHLEALDNLLASLPSNWAKRHAFLRLWLETGRINASADQLGIGRTTANIWIQQLLNHLRPERSRKPKPGPATANPGVCFYAHRAARGLPPWIARVRLPGGKSKSLGCFETAEAGTKAIERHKRLNPPTNTPRAHSTRTPRSTRTPEERKAIKREQTRRWRENNKEQVREYRRGYYAKKAA